MAIENFKEVEEYIREHAESEDVAKFVAQFRQTLDRDNVLAYLESDIGRPLKQSLLDKAEAKAVDRYKETQLAKDIEQEVLRRNPPKSEEAKRLAELEQKYNALEAERMREALKNSTTKLFAEDENLNKYATALSDLVIGSTEEETNNKAAMLKELVAKMSTDIANKHLSATAHKPTPSPGVGSTKSELEKQLEDAEKLWQETKRPSDLVAVNALHRKLKESKG